MTTRLGCHATIELTVTDCDTACFMRSGEVPVLATPRLVALCEEATMNALEAKLEKRLARSRCTTGRISYRRSGLRRGRVVRSSPKAGKHLRNRAAVAIVLSSGR